MIRPIMCGNCQKVILEVNRGTYGISEAKRVGGGYGKLLHVYDIQKHCFHKHKLHVCD